MHGESKHDVEPHRSSRGNLAYGPQWAWCGHWVLDLEHRPCDFNGWWYADGLDSLQKAVRMGTQEEQLLMSTAQLTLLRASGSGVALSRREQDDSTLRQRKWMRMRMRMQRDDPRSARAPPSAR